MSIITNLTNIFSINMLIWLSMNLIIYSLLLWIVLLISAMVFSGSLQKFEKSTEKDLAKKFKNIFWWEPWSYYTGVVEINELLLDTPWHMYYKYRLSIWTNWHILEDRICIFVIIILLILV